MGLSMRDLIQKVKRKGMVNICGQMGQLMKESGWTIKRMDMALTLTPMEQNIRVTGKKTNSMGRALRHGQMELCMKENILKERKTGRDV